MIHTKESVMEQAQVFASAWSLVGSRFGGSIEDASAEKKILDAMIAEVVKQRDELLTAAKNLRDVKGRHHSEQAYKRLMDVLAEMEAV